MSKKKTRAMAKLKHSVPAKRKDAVQRREDVLEGYNGHWTQWIKPKGAALLSESLGRAHFVLKNHGPGDVFLMAEHGDLRDVGAGAVRHTYVHDEVRVENRGKNPVLNEVDFKPLPFKN